MGSVKLQSSFEVEAGRDDTGQTVLAECRDEVSAPLSFRGSLLKGCCIERSRQHTKYSKLQQSALVAAHLVQVFVDVPCPEIVFHVFLANSGFELLHRQVNLGFAVHANAQVFCHDERH